MQKRKLKPREMRSVLIIALSSSVLATALLIQPLGLIGPHEEPSATEQQQNSTVMTLQDDYTYDPYDSFMVGPDLFDRSRQDDVTPATTPTTAETFSGDYDPNSDDQPVPDDYIPVDEEEPVVLEPIEKPQGLVYTEADYVLYIKANSLNLRAGPSTDTSVVAKLSFGDQVTCIGENDKWMKVRFKGELGFVKSEYTSKTMVFRQVSETVYVKSNTLRFRAGPSVKDEILLTLKKDDKLTRIGIGDGWSKVKNSAGKIGYVSSDYLTKTAPVRRTTSSTSGSSGSSGSSSSSSGSGTLYSGNAGKIVDLAYQALGVPYVWGAESMRGMDCTGLTYWAYRQIGVSVPRSTSGYYKAGVGVSYSNIRPGDVIAWDAHPRDGRTTLSHVGIYVGNGMMIHASSRLGKIVKQSVSEYVSWGCKIITIRRFVSG